MELSGSKGQSEEIQAQLGVGEDILLQSISSSHFTAINRKKEKMAFNWPANCGINLSGERPNQMEIVPSDGAPQLGWHDQQLSADGHPLDQTHNQNDN